MKLHIKIVLTIIVTLLLLIYLAGFLPAFSQTPPNWVITGRIMAPGPETTASWIPVTNAILTLTDIEGDIHIVTTGKDGYYFFNNLAVDANCVITAIAIVNGKTMVFKDVIPGPVAAPETYDAGTADAESTALALIVEELIEQGLTHEDIDLEIIQDSENFEIVEEQVLYVLEDNGNVMDDIIVAGEAVASGEEFKDTGVDALDLEATVEEGTAYRVTVALRSPDTTTQTIRDTYTINASFVGSGDIDPSGTVTVNKGLNQTFTITPKRNYHIIGITVDGNLEVGPFGSPYTYTFDNLTDDHTIEAYFAIDTYNIAASVVGSGTIIPSGAVSVNHGSTPTFTIIPDPNYHIDDVLVDGNSVSVGEDGKYTFNNVTEDGHTISATFAIDTYTLTIYTDADGTGSGSVSPTVGVHTYKYGDTVTISATANASSTFSGWSGDASRTSDVTLTMTENKNVTASFAIAINTYTLTMNTGGTGAGTVTIVPDKATYNHGETVTISATADAISSAFSGWSGDASGTSDVTLTMTENKNVTASFAINTYTLTMNTGGTGAGTVTVDPVKENYDHGDEVTITATADIGSIFTGWSGDASGTGDVTLIMDSDKSVTATFNLKKVTLTVTVAGTGSGTVSPAAGVHTYNYGDVVTIGAKPDTGSFATWTSATADIGSIFTGWSGDASGTGDVTLIMDSNKSVTATFTKKKTCTLTVTVAGTGSGTVSPTVGVHTYNYGDVVTIKATPDTTCVTWVSTTADPGSIFTGWSGDASGTSDVTLIMDSDKSVTATFTLKEVTLTPLPEPMVLLI